jgi:hypothetical protein
VVAVVVAGVADRSRRSWLATASSTFADVEDPIVQGSSTCGAAEPEVVGSSTAYRQGWELGTAEAAEIRRETGRMVRSLAAERSVPIDEN